MPATLECFIQHVQRTQCTTPYADTAAPDCKPPNHTLQHTSACISLTCRASESTKMLNPEGRSDESLWGSSAYRRNVQQPRSSRPIKWRCHSKQRQRKRYLLWGGMPAACGAKATRRLRRQALTRAHPMREAHLALSGALHSYCLKVKSTAPSEYGVRWARSGGLDLVGETSGQSRVEDSRPFGVG